MEAKTIAELKRFIGSELESIKNIKANLHRALASIEEFDDKALREHSASYVRTGVKDAAYEARQACHTLVCLEGMLNLLAIQED